VFNFGCESFFEKPPGHPDYSLNFTRRILSTMISRCNSPIPLKIVCFFVGFNSKRRSSTSLAYCHTHFINIGLCFSPIATEITGSGKVMLSSVIGFTQRYAVLISLKPTISPASIKSTGFVSVHLRTRLIRLLLPPVRAHSKHKNQNPGDLNWPSGRVYKRPYKRVRHNFKSKH